MAADDSARPDDLPPAEVRASNERGREASGRYRRFPLELLYGIALDDGPEWLIKGLLPSTGLAVLYGVSGTGKSFLALDAALHIAAGRRWMGRRVRQAGVVYVAAEAGRGFRKRIVAAVDHHGLPRSLPFALVTVAPHLGHHEGDARLLAGDIAAQLPEGFRPGLVVVDTLARTMAGCDESGSAGMGVFIGNAETLGRELGALVLAVHHSGKDLDRGMRGSSALLGAADAVWRIVPDEVDATRTAVRFEKLKDDADKVDLPFALERVELAPDRDGEPRTSCVVIGGPALAQALSNIPVSPTPPSSRETSSGRAAFLETLTAVLERRGSTTRRFKHIPADARIMRQADLADLDEFAFLEGSRKSRQSRIDRHVRDLEAVEQVRRHGGYLWLARDPTFTTIVNNAAE